MRERLLTWWWPRFAGSLLAIGLLMIGTTLTKIAIDPSGGFGHDFFAYLDASRRLVDGGSPYRSELLTGATLTTSQGQFLYPPLLAQLLAPAALLPVAADQWLYAGYGLLSIGALAIASGWCWRRAGGSFTPLGVIGGAFVIAIGAPFFSWVTNGNISGLLVLAVVGALAGRPLLAGGVGALIKLLPGSLALLARRSSLRSRELVLLGAIALSSLALSPLAWVDYATRALPNSVASEDLVGLGGNPAAIARLAGTIADLREDDGEAALAGRLAGADDFDRSIVEKAIRARWAALAPTELLRAIAGLEPVLRIAGLLGALGLSLRGATLANDLRRRHVAVAYLTVGSLLIPWALWDHYLVPLLPLALMSWRLGERATRVRIGLALFVSSAPIAAGIGGNLWIPLALVLLLDGIRRTRLPEPAVAPR